MHALRAMGHGDEIAFVDGNYPAAEHARRLIRADGITLAPLLRAALAIFPVEQVLRSSQNNDPAQFAPVHHEIDALVQEFTAPPVALTGDALYPRIRSAYAIVATSEPALYANVILRKAALPPTNS